MSVGIFDVIKKQATELTLQEKYALVNFLLEEVESEKRGKFSADELKRQKRRQWINANRKEYGGMYVALDGDRLLGTGKNYAEAFEAARSAGVTDAFVDFIAPPDYVGEIGGFE